MSSAAFFTIPVSFFIRWCSIPAHPESVSWAGPFTSYYRKLHPSALQTRRHTDASGWPPALSVVPVMKLALTESCRDVSKRYGRSAMVGETMDVERA